jgi:pimeloyl-ACP methyl ester carboxylesterase
MRVAANGHTLFCAVRGTGPPVLMIMGVGADHLSWGLQVPALAAAGRTVVTFDNRDAGRSTRATGEYAPADLAADAAALMAELGHDRYDVVGASLGGAVAQELTLAHPERVRTLQLVATWARSGAVVGRAAALWLRAADALTDAERAESRMLQVFTEDFFEDEGRVEMMRGLWLSGPQQEPEAFARQLRCAARHDAAGRLGEIPSSLPVHLVAGDRDVLVPVWKTRELAALLPDARVTIIGGAAHALNVEFAAQLNEALVGFLAEHG